MEGVTRCVPEYERSTISVFLMHMIRYGCGRDNTLAAHREMQASGDPDFIPRWAEEQLARALEAPLNGSGGG